MPLLPAAQKMTIDSAHAFVIPCAHASLVSLDGSQVCGRAADSISTHSSYNAIVLAPHTMVCRNN